MQLLSQMLNGFIILGIFSRFPSLEIYPNLHSCLQCVRACFFTSCQHNIISTFLKKVDSQFNFDFSLCFYKYNCFFLCLKGACIFILTVYIPLPSFIGLLVDPEIIVEALYILETFSFGLRPKL